MELNFTNNKVDIWTKNEYLGIYAITTRSVRQALKLNRLLGHYPEDTKFTRGEEPTFYFSVAQIKPIAQEVPYIGKILAQITKGSKVHGRNNYRQ